MKNLNTTKAVLFVALASVTAASQAFTFSTGFETAEGFTVGAINGQNGFTTFDAAASAPVISNANPNGGSQHLRLPDDPVAANGTLNGAFTPDFTPDLNGDEVFFNTSLDLAISGVEGADYDIVGQDTVQGLLTYRLKFEWLQNIQVFTDIGNGLEFVDTGFTWDANGYQSVEIDYDQTTDTIDYYYAGNLIYTSGAITAGVGMTQVIMFSDSWQNAGETGDIDNLTFSAEPVPEPATMTLLGLGALAALRKRRKA